MSGAGIGHNRGPTMEPGAAWRRHCWGAARAALLPHLPIEVLRGRLRRAADLGLDYSTYAGIRAASGHDVVAVLFSSNALRAAPAMPLPRQERLAALRGAARIGLACPPLAAPALMKASAGALDGAHPAPGAHAPWAAARAALRAALGPVPGSGAILVGAWEAEAGWVPAAGLAGYVSEARFFAGI